MGAATAALMLVAAVAVAQDQATPPDRPFEVASVKTEYGR
jgi:hypothetical protein